MTVGEARRTFTEAVAEAAAALPVGDGLDEGTQMGPVITPQSKARIEGLIQKGADEGARVLVDGRHPVIPGYEHGNFVRPTILQDVNPAGEIANTEIFGPVLSLIHVSTIDDAIELVNSGRYGNMACLFTRDGAAARKFSARARVQELARVLAAFGSPHRLQILISLLYGPANYRTLQRASKLKPGPFYHHINQLRLAGFLGPKTRDLYVLTRAGRNALLIALSLAPLLKDQRIRPMPVTAE